MKDQSNLLLPLSEDNDLIENNNSRIMKMQQNLIMMGFNITMVNKVITHFKISTEDEALNYLMKSENGMWNHPFIPSEEEQEEQEEPKEIKISHPKDLMDTVLSKFNQLKRASTFSGEKKNSIDIDDENENEKKQKKKIVNENICDICGEAKEFHYIKKFTLQDNIIDNDDEEDEKMDNIFIINENLKLINNKINTNTNIIKIENDDVEQEEEDNEICRICMGEFDEPIEIDNFRHKFCKVCFHDYLVDKIKNNQIEKISCPKEKCKNQNLSVKYFSKYLSEKEYNKYLQFKTKNEIEKDTKKIFCPLCDSYADIEEEQLIKIENNNPDYRKSVLTCKNGHNFCSCGRPIHEGDCNKDEKNFQKFLAKENIKKCPKCGFCIKKNRGCNHMTCGNLTCKYQFCWICLKEYFPEILREGLVGVYNL